jgi:hypothetical protein
MAKHPCETFRPNGFERAEAFTGPLSTYFDPKPFGEMQTLSVSSEETGPQRQWEVTSCMLYWLPQ